MDSFEIGRMIEEKEFRRALDRCYSQSQNPTVCRLNLQKIPSRSDFQKLLEELGVELRTNAEDRMISVYTDGNFHDLVKKLDVYCNDENVSILKFFLTSVF
ncbi:unnamed protein product [Gongylonema pulchrum]|uniref:PRE_C2HC domain-containing protein n=1 Tax=Gongylonema pulchrum TaxID=637853 RepID=A0A183E5L5_9BILA|nr:unnamed protein product [Gongylonema pulchrum]